MFQFFLVPIIFGMVVACVLPHFVGMYSEHTSERILESTDLHATTDSTAAADTTNESTIQERNENESVKSNADVATMDPVYLMKRIQHNSKLMQRQREFMSKIGAKPGVPPNPLELMQRMMQEPELCEIQMAIMREAMEKQ